MSSLTPAASVSPLTLPPWPLSPQVWFKNRRAKCTRLLRLPRKQGGQALALPQDPGVCTPVPATLPAAAPAPLPVAAPVIAPVPAAAPVPAPVPMLAPEGSEYPGGPVFSDGPGLSSPLLPSPMGVFPAAESSVPSHSQAQWQTTLVDQNMLLAAPNPAHSAAPLWPQGTYATNLSPDPVVTPDFTELLSLQDLLEESFSSFPSGSQEEDFMEEIPWMLLDE